MINLRYFKPEEFVRSSYPPGSIADMNSEFLQVLDSVRHSAGVPFVLTCSYRSRAWDISKGREYVSYHTLGRAVDVRCTDGSTRKKIISAALEFGLSVGVYSTFLHLDNRENQIVFRGDK